MTSQARYFVERRAPLFLSSEHRCLSLDAQTCGAIGSNIYAGSAGTAASSAVPYTATGLTHNVRVQRREPKGEARRLLSAAAHS